MNDIKMLLIKAVLLIQISGRFSWFLAIKIGSENEKTALNQNSLQDAKNSLEFIHLNGNICQTSPTTAKKS